MTEPLVLLPGMMCDDRLFTPQIRAFCPDRAVMIAPISQGDRVEDIVRNLLDQLPERFALAGLSMGGIVAMEVLNRAPKRVTRLCLMDTNPLAESAAVAAAREPMIVGAQAGRLDEVMREALRPEFLAPGPKRLEVLNLMYQMAADLGAELFVRQSRALQRRPDQQATLRKCKLPTLIMCGEHDKLTPVRRHEFMAELIPGAHLKIILNAGHIPTLEQPEATNAAMRDWLDQRIDG
ncbi:MAG: pimeloyl-ACP methyl ester carboxylesterase [Paracoccaceae bacterium]|jgi:pimeloyl-ACP methyl ester carboxylesterase